MTLGDITLYSDLSVPGVDSGPFEKKIVVCTLYYFIETTTRVIETPAFRTTLTRFIKHKRSKEQMKKLL